MIQNPLHIHSRPIKQLSKFRIDFQSDLYFYIEIEIAILRQCKKWQSKKCHKIYILHIK